MYVRLEVPQTPTEGLDGRQRHVSKTATLPERRATLSRELSEFLIELSIGVHRYAMYPPNHPSLAPVVENIVGRLSELFEERRSLSIGVAQRQLVIEGVATDQKHPVLSDLAQRLHDHQLGAIGLNKGVTATEVSGFLEQLAKDPERDGVPLGLIPTGEAPRWEHAHLHGVGYEQLQMMDEEGAQLGGMDRATTLWLGLAQAALGSDEPLESVPDAETIARSIEGHRGEAGYDEVIVDYLLQLAGELRDEGGGESEKVRRRVSKLIDELDDGTLDQLIRFGGSTARRRRFLLDANQSLAVDSVMKVLSAAAASEEQSISHSMTRLLTKLATHAERGSATVRSQADTALRENVEALISGWELKDPNPEEYTNVLDAMSRSAPIFQTPEETEGNISGAERLVEMALEVDAYGPIVGKALSDLIEEGGTGVLLDRIKQAPASSRIANQFRQHLTSPSQFRKILAGGQIDDAALHGLIEQMGAGAVDPLLDVLADSDSRAVRRRVFDALVSMGPFVAQRTVERLEQDHRWFVLRNMLALLQRLEHVPDEFDPQPFVEHADERVRREALPLALRKPALRDRTLVGSLSDSDERIVRMGLLELQQGVPDAVVPTLVNRVVKPGERSDEIKTLAAKVLGTSRAALARKTLLDLATSGKTMFGKAKLAGSSPVVLAAVHGLATGWPDEEDVKAVLEQAARSKDPDVRGAVRVARSDASR